MHRPHLCHDSTSSQYHEQTQGALPSFSTHHRSQSHCVQFPSLTNILPTEIDDTDADSGLPSSPASIEKCSFETIHTSTAIEHNFDEGLDSPDVIEYVCLVQFLLRIYGNVTNRSGSEIAPLENVVLYDLRENRLYQNRHLRGAKNANCHSRIMASRAVRNDMKSAIGRNRIVYIYDKSSSLGSHSQLFIEHLRKRGDSVVLLEGGFDENVATIHTAYLGSSMNEEERKEMSCSPTSSHGYDAEDVLNANMSRILPHLFLGNQRDSQDYDLLAEHSINYIINVTKDAPNKFTDKNIKYLKLPASDDHNQSLIQFFDTACQFILDAEHCGGRVLVHCRAGVSRSATIVLAYLVATRRMPPTEAFDFLMRQRPIVSPNFHFLGQIEKYYKQVLRQDKRFVQAPKNDVTELLAIPSKLSYSNATSVHSAVADDSQQSLLLAMPDVEGGIELLQLGKPHERAMDLSAAAKNSSTNHPLSCPVDMMRKKRNSTDGRKVNSLKFDNHFCTTITSAAQ